jgi:hypothetical protein
MLRSHVSHSLSLIFVDTKDAVHTENLKPTSDEGLNPGPC